MSLPWNSSLLLQVEPGAIVATLETGWPRRRRVSASAPPAGAQADGSAGVIATPGLDPQMLDTVLDGIELSAPVRGASLSVELADPLVHFDVVEGDFGAQGDRQLQSIAVACMGELLGEAAGEHEVRWSLQAGERHLVIAAVSRALIASLAAAAELRGLRLDSVQPAFGRRWNAFARGLKASTAVFASTSGAHAVVSCVVDRAVCAVSAGPWQEERGPVSTGPAATASAESLSLLDDRAARLLASIGIESSVESDYLLVSANAPGAAAASRWSVVDPSGSPA
ncbi:MAG: hypothetical protein ACXWJG_12680 [Caldimonas sp.]